MSKNVFDYFLYSEAQKFVFFSMVKAAADKMEGVLAQEVELALVEP